MAFVLVLDYNALMDNQTRFKPYQPNQLLLLPPDMRQWLPEDDLAYFITGRDKHSKLPEPPPLGRIPKEATKLEQMSRKLRTKKGRETYSKRKEIVEPVFGQIKEGRGFRRFLLRGLENVMAEWDLICLTRNLLKVFRSGLMPKGE